MSLHASPGGLWDEPHSSCPNIYVKDYQSLVVILHLFDDIPVTILIESFDAKRLGHSLGNYNLPHVQWIAVWRALLASIQVAVKNEPELAYMPYFIEAVLNP